MIGYFIFGIAFLGSVLAGYTDIRIREVPNWLSFGLIFSMLVLRVLYSYQYNDFSLLWIPLVVGACFFLLGIAFFYAGQWGGADVKLLTALGLGFGTVLLEFRPYFVAQWPFIFTVLLNFFMIAVVYSISYAVILYLKNSKVKKDFVGSLNKYELLVGALLVAIGLVLGIGYGFTFLGTFLPVVFLVLLPLLWFLSKFLKSVEKYCLYKRVSVKKLVEFDVPKKDVKLGKKIIVSKKDPNGMTLKQIRQIQKYVKKRKLPKSIEVKWGVPLIPVFSITILVSVLFGDLAYALISFLMA